MIKILLLVLFLLPENAKAGSLDLGGVAEFLGDMVKKSKGATLVDLNRGVSGGVYIPVWTFHDLQGIDYVEVGGGGALREGGHGEPLILVAVNGPAISGRLWGGEWARTHVKRIKLPDIWFGPYIKVPFPGKPWVIGREVGGFVSIGLGSKSPATGSSEPN